MEEVKPEKPVGILEAVRVSVSGMRGWTGSRSRSHSSGRSAVQLEKLRTVDRRELTECSPSP